MKVYYNFSARGIPKYTPEYIQIDQVINALGHTHIFSNKFNADLAEKIYSAPEDELKDIYAEAIRNISRCDVLVLEITLPSISQGFIINKALTDNKPVIALYLEGSTPAFVIGINDEKLQVLQYSQENIRDVLKSALHFAQTKTDVRFNFFISAEMSTFLSELARENHKPKSNLLREQIKKMMDETSQES